MMDDIPDFFNRLDVRNDHGCSSGVQDTTDMPVGLGRRPHNGRDTDVIASENQLGNGTQVERRVFHVYEDAVESGHLGHHRNLVAQCILDCDNWSDLAAQDSITEWIRNGVSWVSY